MSSYEFWDELGKIFNAVVAYQEKNLEFNKKFISPWIRLGNVFEKQDRNKEAMNAYERAIEIDSGNPQNWYELGNIHFKMENHPEAVSAFHRAIELDPGFGWAYNNLALTMASSGETDQAVSLYQKAIELLEDAKDQAVAWNRLGNAYRKLNQYEQALAAFHKADELDRENSGFRDNMDEVTDGPTLVEPAAEVEPGEPAPTHSISPTEARAPDNIATEEQPTMEAPPLAEAVAAATASASAGAEPQDGTAPAEAAVAATAAEVKVEARAEETVTVVVQDSTQTFTETLAITPAGSETGDTEPETSQEADLPEADETQTTDVVTSGETAPVELPMPTLPIAAEEEAAASEDIGLDGAEPQVEGTAIDAGELLDPAPNSLADQLLEAEPEVLDVAQQVAYEAFLKDTSEPLNSIGVEEDPEPEVELPGSPEPVAKIDESGELQIEMDTKNAHVWNELGNVYFNTSAFDDAIVAYSKAIELDRWFAWPYSNLALAYVQKRRFVEAILLYQRSIELFSTDKDKAISWNRLGNVYRRLNDYENAIAAYQRADALDPDNSTLSLQSRFSLLGNYAMEQKPSYVS